MWDQSGMTPHLLAMMIDDIIAGRVESFNVSGECRAITANHGLSPKAM
jgi:hypothetical protein